MKKQLAIFMFCCLAWFIASGQTGSTVLINGTVTDEKNVPQVAASVSVKNSSNGTITNEKGEFRLEVASLPVTLVFSSAGTETAEKLIISAEPVQVTLLSFYRILDAVIIANGDSRIAGKILEKPVSIETVKKADILNAAGAPYDIPLMKKGVDVTISSLTYRTYSTRGFNGSGSSRVNQLMDGMDNQAPGLNFSVGNFIGLTDLDLESIEILPGASSALYGPGGMNGTFIINGKNPFKHTGLSVQVKNGITDVGKQQRSTVGGFYDYAIRYAKNFNDRFAFKLSAQYLQAKDWLANDSSNYRRSGTSGQVVAGNRITDPNYDGVNVYGDETTVDLRAFLQGAPVPPEIIQPFMSSPLLVSRTGYHEMETIDPDTKNLKLSGALHYRFKNNVEAILAGHWAKGNTVYSGNNRYALKDIKVGQYKLELKNKNWFWRTYTTQENAGEAYSATVTTQIFNEAWKRSYDTANVSGSWYPQYTGAFVTGAAQIFQQVMMGGGTIAQAQAAVVAAAPQLHIASRNFADQGRPVAGTPQFNQLFDQVRKIPIPNGGLFLETSQLWMSEGQYNFSDKFSFADVIIGGNVKKYILDSKGTLFYEPNGPIKINEWGSYIQASKKLFDDVLTLTASGRFDKNENFKGKLTPRVMALVKLAENHNLRISYQTAYKFPTTQQQWIYLDVGSAILLGGLPWINDVLEPGKYPTFVFNNGQTTPWNYKELKPESMRSFEIGMKNYIGKKLLVDAYAYFGKYSDFLGRIVLVQPSRQSKPWSIVVNSDTKINTWGAGIGFDYKMARNFFSSLNAYTDNLTNVPSGFMAGFNTPKYRVNAGFGNNGLGKSERLGFALNLRWQDDLWWEGAGLADGNVKAYTTLDAQLNYKFPKIGSMIKIGGTNITNRFYQTGFGNPSIGGLYYASFVYNIL